ncbi:tellurite resistance TerB family protein [Mangrovicella endophytica]|uniref:tellurite resistance TerB family protein n=1 Tax=Mangrovicella endophytica TaxID=2066697 RepID=UPI000C9DC42D|nr:tellurite resistance TerB family protein [Mangrovicella endophytica]
MLDVQKLLGQFLGAGMPGGSGHSGQQGRPGQGGSASSFGSGGGSIQDQIGGLLRTHGASALSGGLAGGLASQLFRGKGLSKLGGTALKVGGAALVAGLAYKAYQNYQGKTGGFSGAGFGGFGGGASTPSAGASDGAIALPAPEGTPFLPKGEEEDRARLMLSAMIAAAKADGYIDAGEQQAIFGRIGELDLDSEAKGFVIDEMQKPLSVDELVSRATTPEAAVEVYTASLLAIDPDHPAEKAYLDMLAARLNLPAELTAEVRRTADEVTGS